MFIKTNNQIRVTDSNVQSFKLLPNGTYLTKFDAPNNQYYLEVTENFTIPNKIYGNSELLSNRYVTTFNGNDKNMGILLTGLKGTGKSLTAKLTAIKTNLPIILITEEFIGEEFKSFLSSIKQEVVIFIDEFEKVYSEKDGSQQSLLSILDGVFEGKKLFIFTSNMTNKINTYMINRPGRIRYLAEYESLDEDIINDVVNDLLIDKSNIDDLLEIVDMLGVINMDVLIGLISEMNLYGETASEAIKYLNVRPEDAQYSVNVIINGVKNGSTSVRIHPLRIVDTYIEFYNSVKKEWDDVRLNSVEWDIKRDGKLITMKLDDVILHFEPSEKAKSLF